MKCNCIAVSREIINILDFERRRRSWHWGRKTGAVEGSPRSIWFPELLCCQVPTCSSGRSRSTAPGQGWDVQYRQVLRGQGNEGKNPRLVQDISVHCKSLNSEILYENAALVYNSMFSIGLSHKYRLSGSATTSRAQAKSQWSGWMAVFMPGSGSHLTPSSTLLMLCFRRWILASDPRYQFLINKIFAVTTPRRKTFHNLTIRINLNLEPSIIQ